MSPADINQRLHDQPFRPFRILLSDGSSIALTKAGTIIVGETSAIVPVELGHDSQGYPLVKRWRTVALAHIVQFSDIDESVTGKGKKKS